MNLHQFFSNSSSQSNNKYLPLADIRIQTQIQDNITYLYLNTIHPRTGIFEELQDSNRAALLADTIQIVESLLNSIYLTYKNNPEETWKNWSKIVAREEGYKEIKKKMVYNAANYYFYNAALFEQKFMMIWNDTMNLHKMGKENRNRKYYSIFLDANVKQKWKVSIFPIFNGFVTSSYNFIPDNTKISIEVYELEDAEDADTEELLIK